MRQLWCLLKGENCTEKYPTCGTGTFKVKIQHHMHGEQIRKQMQRILHFFKILLPDSVRFSLQLKCAMFSIPSLPNTLTLFAYTGQSLFLPLCAPVCLCVDCVLPGAQPCLDLHTGGRPIMKSSTEVTERLAGMQLNSAQTIWSTVLSVTHIHKPTAPPYL